MGMLRQRGDLAIVVGGYNSSNTSHLVELCEEKLPTFFISDEQKILSGEKILNYDLHRKTEMETLQWLPAVRPVSILLSSGASCPDALVESVITRLLEFFPEARTIEELVAEFQ